MTKKYDSGSNLNQKILTGVNILADNVAATYGPRGRNVILQSVGKRPIITKDGVTVANFVDLDDPIENASAQIIKQAAAQTNHDAGDGTTTATILARGILTKAQKYLSAGSSPIELKRGMDKAVVGLVDALHEQSRPIKDFADIKHIATISANGDYTIGNLIATAVDQVGKDGAITVEEARSVNTSLELVEGFQFDGGYFSPSFITDERKKIVKYDKPYFLITDAKIATVDEMMPILELIARENRPLVIVAEEVEGQALAALIVNTTRGSLNVAAVKAPRYGEERRNILKDLAVATGATYIARENAMQLREAKLKDLGTSDSIEITKNMTTVVGGKGDAKMVQQRIDDIKQEIKETGDFSAVGENGTGAEGQQNHFRAQILQQRITRLASGIAIIRVGAATEVEMIEKKHRIEDALEAVRSAQQEGIVAGGGVALLRAAEGLNVEVANEDQRLGVELLKIVAAEPLRQMADNAGESPDIVVSMVSKETENYGYDFTTQKLEDMYQIGVVDPVKVTRCALQNAVSVASTLITTNHAIIQV